VRGMAASAGTLFVRSYERGERVYLAMLARGYEGTMPVLEGRRRTAADWWAAALPLAAWTFAVAALVAA
jgi:cobalt/nickel transport system permease protein